MWMKTSAYSVHDVVRVMIFAKGVVEEVRWIQRPFYHGSTV